MQTNGGSPLSPLNRGISRVMRRRAGERDLNQSELARLAGVGAYQVNHWWRERRAMSAEDMLAIATALGVDAGVFLTEAQAAAEQIRAEDAAANDARASSAPSPNDEPRVERETAGDRLRRQGPKAVPRTGHSSSSTDRRRPESR